MGLNIREVKVDTCLPTGGGVDGQQPVSVVKGEQVGMYSQRPAKGIEYKELALTGLCSILGDEFTAARDCYGFC